MFKIEPVQNKDRQKELCEAFHIDFKPDFFAYLMYDLNSGELMGISQFEIRGDYGYISDLRSAKDSFDQEAMFILGRQTMNFIDLCGAHLCKAPISVGDAKLFSAIGFTRNGEQYFCDMNGMFDGHCDGHAVELK